MPPPSARMPLVPNSDVTAVNSNVTARGSDAHHRQLGCHRRQLECHVAPLGYPLAQAQRLSRLQKWLRHPASDPWNHCGGVRLRRTMMAKPSKNQQPWVERGTSDTHIDPEGIADRRSHSSQTFSAIPPGSIAPTCQPEVSLVPRSTSGYCFCYGFAIPDSQNGPHAPSYGQTPNCGGTPLPLSSHPGARPARRRKVAGPSWKRRLKTREK